MIELLNIDCMEYMKGLPDQVYDAIITDPPYHRVKDEYWDKQFSSSELYIKWIEDLVDEFQRILKPNGSLYIFASPQMAARVEVAVSRKFNVLTNITWRKASPGNGPSGWLRKTKKDELRSFLYESEKIIFAEHYNSDNIAIGEPGYNSKVDELRGFLFEPLRLYLRGEFDRAGVNIREADKFCQVSSMASRHYFGRAQWILPTKENYASMQKGLNAKKENQEYLRKEYEELRKEYEELRKEYEELRRPFSVTNKDQWSDVWEFMPVSAYHGKHPCEKPINLLLHILISSVRKGALVFDPFFGSGSLSVASYHHGCDFVGCELDTDYFEAAKERVDMETRQLAMFGQS